MNPHACKKCGTQMIVESRSIAAVRKNKHTGSYDLAYTVTEVCPKRYGFLGIFYAHHDNITYRNKDDDSYGAEER